MTDLDFWTAKLGNIESHWDAWATLAFVCLWGRPRGAENQHTKAIRRLDVLRRGFAFRQLMLPVAPPRPLRPQEDVVVLGLQSQEIAISVGSLLLAPDLDWTERVRTAVASHAGNDSWLVRHCAEWAMQAYESRIVLPLFLPPVPNKMEAWRSRVRVPGARHLWQTKP